MATWHHLLRCSIATCWFMTFAAAIPSVNAEELQETALPESLTQTQASAEPFQHSPELTSPELPGVIEDLSSNEIIPTANLSPEPVSIEALEADVDNSTTATSQPSNTLPDVYSPIHLISDPTEELEANLGNSIPPESANDPTELAPESDILSPEPLPATTPETTLNTPTNLLEPPNSEPEATNNVASTLDSGYEFSIFPVGLNLGDRNVLATSLIKGIETGADSFDQWLIPFDDVMQALLATVTLLDDGSWELRSPGFVIQLSPNDLKNDPDLGLVFSIQQIETRLGVPTSFDQLDYAIRFDPPWADPHSRHRRRRQAEAAPIITEGLPAIQSSSFGISGIAQEVTVFNRAGQGDAITEGGFSSLGTAFGGSWYLQADQAQLTDASSWRLRQFQYLRQTDSSDTVLGSQSIFWNSVRSNSSTGRYWGASYVHRWGFTPPTPRLTGGFSPDQRRQAETIGRTVTGEADPGTLVQLTQGFRNQIIDEVLVDSSGIYRFEDVTSLRGGGSYEVLLYPDGQLTAVPETRTATFSSLPGQLPAGAETLILSGGTNQLSNNSFLGEFNDFRGGIAYRQGISETLTLGTGFIYDQTPQALVEAFYVSNDLPLKVAISALADLETADTTINADVRFRPSRNFYFDFDSDRFSQRFNTEWKATKNLTFISRGDTRSEAISGGARLFLNTPTLSFLGNALIDTRGQLRWNLNARAGALGLRHFGNDTTTRSELFYNLSGGRAYGDGHGLLLNYNTGNNNNQLATVSWRYRSARTNARRNSRWDVQLGYGVGSQGNGIIASLTAPLFPGLDIRARYQGISTVSDSDTFRIDFLPRINFQNGLSLADRDQDRLRTQGGMIIQPFLDENGDGIQSKGEPLYTEDIELLVLINNETLNQYRPDLRRQGTFLQLPPDLYRLDLDPAGYPIGWQATETAYAVTTFAGEYTSVEIPLSRAYTLLGTVTDADGNTISGQRVEAIALNSGKSQISVTNAAGVFYLEGLSQDEYRFQINGEPVDNATLNFQTQSEELQEVNFQSRPDSLNWIIQSDS